MHLEKAQTEPEAAYAVHDATADCLGEEISREAVSVHRGTGRVLKQLEPDRDTGEDLVPEPAGKVQADTGSGN